MSTRTITTGAITLALSLALAPGASAQFDPDDHSNETILAGQIGSSFDNSATSDGSLEFGGSLSWLWSGMVGAEVLAGFAPNYSIVGRDDTWFNNYMFNGVGAVPLADGRVQPFVSGGIGAMTLRTSGDAEDILGEVDETELAGNVGAGVMAFAGPWGVRGDVRYIAQIGEAEAGTSFLEDADFWRGGVGVAYRW